MTPRLAPALTGPPASTVPPGAGRRPSSTPRDDFSALLGAAGDRPAPADTGGEPQEASRRLAREARLEPRQDARPGGDRSAADRAAADRAGADRAAADRRTADRAGADRAAADRRADDRRADDRRASGRPAERRADERRAGERRADERRGEAQRAAGDDRASRRESVGRRQEESSARADRAAHRESDRSRAGADSVRDEAETAVRALDDQAQSPSPQGEGETPAAPGQAVVAGGEPTTAALDGHAGAAPVDPALLALVGAALDATAPPTVAGPAGPAGAGGGAVPGLAGGALPQDLTVPQPGTAGETVAATAAVGDALGTPAAVAATGGPAAAPTGTDAAHGVPLQDAATTGTTTGGPVDLAVLDGATPLPGDAGAGGSAEGGPQQDQALQPAVVPTEPIADGSVGVEDGDSGVAAVAAPAGAPSPRAEAALGAVGRPDASTPTDTPAAEAAVERANLGPTVADLARAAHRDGSGATRVVIRLDPPELGTVTVAVTVRGGDVRVSLVAEAGVVPVLDARREDVHRALSDAGLALGGYDVSSGSHQGQERQQEARDRAAAAGRPWRALGPGMDFERAAAVDRAARGVWL